MADRFDDGGAGVLYKEVWPTSSRTALHLAEIEGKVGVNASAQGAPDLAENARLPVDLAGGGGAQSQRPARDRFRGLCP